MFKKKFTQSLPKLYKEHLHPECRFKHVAVIVKGGKILSIGFNNMRSHPMAMKPLNVLKNKKEIDELDLRTIHAEMDAIRKIKDKSLLSSCEIWIYSEDKKGNLRISKPCELCLYYINLYNIKNIYYTNNNFWEKM